ncbi:ATP-binding protein [Ferrovibrio sp.]|uniref:ATP-binding protein n=2 Tax=Ferrovibrio sp. TaxID=1917215 RepID=UPI0025BCE466|nr:ATP-binding protein [Ferrovibrio sp.]MBX3455891.1 PAS domain S-box protein [Ferrovibrio sp.]
MAKSADNRPAGTSVASTLAHFTIRHIGLREQVALFLLAIILATLLLILVKSWLQFDKNRQLAEQDAVLLAERVASSVLRVVDAQVGHLYLFGQGNPPDVSYAERCERQARTFLGFQHRYLIFGLADATGHVLCSSNPTASQTILLGDRAWFREIQQGKATSFETLIGRSSYKPVLVAGLRIEYENAPMQVAFSSIDLGWIAAILHQEAKNMESMIVSLIDGSGQLLAHTGLSDSGLTTMPAPAELWAGIKASKTNVRTVDIDGVERKFFIIPVHLAGQDRFYIASGINHVTQADEIRAVLADLWGGYFILTLFTVIIGFLLTERMINKPLSRIMSSLQRYEAGDRKTRVGPPYMPNEIGALGMAMDQLADAVDIRDSELARRQQNMEALLKRLEAIIAASPVPIAWLSADWRVKLWNHAAERVFGYSAEEAIGNTPPIVPEDQAEASRDLVARVFRGEVIEGVDLKRRHKSGHMLDVRASIAPLRDADGHVDGCLVIFIDETERRMIEHQFAQAQKMEALGQLTGGLSHDFNNLLGIVIGNMDFLLDSLDEKPELKAFAQSALNAALQGAELNKRLLAFARRQPLTPQPIQVGREIANAMAMLKRAMGEQYQVESDVALDIWPVRADPTQLNTALLNLGLNARDAMLGGGKLLIEARNRTIDADMAAGVAPDFPPGDYVCLSVSDTGSGMPEAVVKRVFEPFFTTKEVGKGTGLGLSMVHGFAKQSGGHVTVYSELGTGTTFRLYLPRLGRGEADEEPGQAGNMAANPKQITVLLVEDNTGLRLVARQQLNTIGCTVLEAEHAAAALPILQSDARIDLMLSDIVMPGGMNGRELAARAEQLRPGLKILLMSGYSDPRQHDDPKGEHEDTRWPLLTKPFRRQELHEAILALLGPA